MELSEAVMESAAEPVSGNSKLRLACQTLIKFATRELGTETVAEQDVARDREARNLTACLTVGNAAVYLGVSPATLRNWDRTGKLKATRHPINGYRLYSIEQLQKLMAELVASDETG